MKKMKLYILLLLVPLLLMGCIEKGKPASGINVEVDSSLGGYTWEQLQNQVKNTNYGIEANRYWIDYVSNKTINSDDKVDVDNLSVYLQKNIYNKIIVKDSTFNYNTTISELETLEKTSIKSLEMYNEDELTVIKDSLKEFVKTTPTVSGSAIITNIENTKQNIIDRKAINSFYSPLYDLYTHSYGALGLKKIETINYFNSINFSITGVLNNNMNISAAYNSLLMEIAVIKDNKNSSYVSFLDSNLLNRMEELEVQYKKMIQGTGKYDSITSARALLRLSDSTQLSKIMVIYWSDVIDDIYTKLDNLQGLDPADSEIVLYLINHIDSYYNLNKQYDKTNYSLIHSKTANIIKEFSFLEKNYKEYLNTQLGLNVF